MTAHSLDTDGTPVGPAPAGQDGTGGPDGAGGRAGMVRSVRVGRQAIYDVQRKLVSFELLFRNSENGSGPQVAGEQATSQVIASTFGTFGLDAISDGRPVFINFTRAFLTGVIPVPVEPANVVIAVGEALEADHELLLGLGQLRQAGYRLAVRDYRGEVGRSALLEVADYVSLSVNALPSLVLPGLVAQVRQVGATLIAIDVEDAPTFTRGVELGFDLFQGPHLAKATVLEQRTLSPSQLICARLLNDLADPEVSVHRVEQLVGTDPGLTLRLLRTANSAASGMTREVTSLRQALVLIGPRRLRSWVVLTLLEGGTTRNTSDDLWSVLARAHTCQRLATDDGDLAFTIGLLSGCADLLGTDVAAVADGSGVGPEARRALLDGEGPAGRALQAVLAHERDDVAAVTAAGLVPFDVSRAYLESLSESLQLVHDLLG
jgi:EAL and modified HD-GYP domain-containing signal transduction protein